MSTFIAKLVVKDGREGEFEKLQQELSNLAHEKEPDTLVYDVIKHTEQARTYVVYARFKDEAAFEYHQATDFHERLVPLIMDCLAGEMELEFFDWVA